MSEQADNTALENAEVLADTEMEDVEVVEDFEDDSKETSSELTEKIDTTKAFSKRLNEEKAKIEGKYTKQLKDIEDVLKAEGYEGDLEAMLKAAKAKATGKTVDELTAEELQIENLIANHPSVKAAQEMLLENRFSSDLAALKAAFPEDTHVQKLKSIRDLGDDFIKLMATDVVGVEEAYIALKAKEDKGKKPVPPSTGEIGKTGKIEKEFYTQDEIDRMSKDELKKDDVWKKVLLSLSKK